MKSKNNKHKAIFWDYDMSRINLKDPKVKSWYLSRKINFGDFSGISKSDLRKYLPRFDISPSLRELLQNFLKAK